MQFFQLTTLLAVAATVSAVAIPDTDNWKTTSDCGDKPTTTAVWGEKPTTTSKWGEKPTTTSKWGEEPTTTSKWGEEPTTTSKWGEEPTTTSKWGGDQPTTTSKWGGDKPTTTSAWGGDKPWGTTTAPASPTGTGTSACNTNGGWSFIPVSQCSAEGGEPYQCTTIGLLNLLNCISLLNGNSVTIPISVSIL